MTISIQPASGVDTPRRGFRREFLPSALGLNRSYEKGARLWEPGHPCHSVFIVQRGEVEILVQGPVLHEVVVRVVKPGELCGFFQFCTNSLPHTTARAIVRTTVLEVPFEEFKNYVRSRPQMLFALLSTACEHLRFSEQRAHILGCRSAEDRLMGLLLQLAERTGRTSPQEPEFMRIQYTHSQLARMSGLNRSHVSVVLGRLRSEQVVRYGRGTPILLNMRLLRERLDSDQGSSSAFLKLRGAPLAG